MIGWKTACRHGSAGHTCALMHTHSCTQKNIFLKCRLLFLDYFLLKLHFLVCSRLFSGNHGKCNLTPGNIKNIRSENSWESKKTALSLIGNIWFQAPEERTAEHRIWNHITANACVWWAGPCKITHVPVTIRQIQDSGGGVGDFKIETNVCDIKMGLGELKLSPFTHQGCVWQENILAQS